MTRDERIKVKHLPDIMNNIFSAEFNLKKVLNELDYLNNVLAPKRPTKDMIQRGEEVINQFKNETVPSKILAKEIYIHMISSLFEDNVLEENDMITDGPFRLYVEKEKEND